MTFCERRYMTGSDEICPRSIRNYLFLAARIRNRPVFNVLHQNVVRAVGIYVVHLAH